jgi:hypothetical protein
VVVRASQRLNPSSSDSDISYQGDGDDNISDESDPDAALSGEEPLPSEEDSEAAEREASRAAKRSAKYSRCEEILHPGRVWTLRLALRQHVKNK